MAKTDTSPEGMTVGKRFLVQSYLAGGSFGRLHIGKNLKTGELVAIKMEKKDIERPQLGFEYKFFKLLKAEGTYTKGIPQIFYFGQCGNWSALVMELLGPSLEKVHERCNSLFTLKTTILLTVQLIHILEYFHGKGLIYRDMKPENFLFGPSGSDKWSTVHIIDLGLSKEYREENGTHIKFRDGKGMTGTVRYVSINSHKGFEVSRRDDMEALGYMLIFFLKGELPWMGLKGKDVKAKYKLIGTVKEKTKPEALCADLPVEFTGYLTTVRNLAFEEEPKYSDYIKMFSKLFGRLGFKNDRQYCFDANHNPIKDK